MQPYTRFQKTRMECAFNSPLIRVFSINFVYPFWLASLNEFVHGSTIEFVIISFLFLHLFCGHNKLEIETHRTTN